jgi:drug/metabolite transporter (DMT)-like permease
MIVVVSPLLVTLGASTFADERFSPITLTGIILVSLGIIGLAIADYRLNLKSTVAALTTGLFIAVFTLVDGIGARLSSHPVSYAAWVFLLQGAPMPLIFFAARGRLIAIVPNVETVKAILAGIASSFAYGLVIWALALSPMGPVAALRETSILFAVIIGRLFLGEGLTIKRVLSASTIFLGTLILAAQTVTG